MRVNHCKPIWSSLNSVVPTKTEVLLKKHGIKSSTIQRRVKSNKIHRIQVKDLSPPREVKPIQSGVPRSVGEIRGSEEQNVCVWFAWVLEYDSTESTIFRQSHEAVEYSENWCGRGRCKAFLDWQRGASQKHCRLGAVVAGGAVR